VGVTPISSGDELAADQREQNSRQPSHNGAKPKFCCDYPTRDTELVPDFEIGGLFVFFASVHN
jgi:hypothetical protein